MKNTQIYKLKQKNSDETVEKHANSDPELAEGPEFDLGTWRFGKLNVRFIPFSTVLPELHHPIIYKDL